MHDNKLVLVGVCVHANLCVGGYTSASGLFELVSDVTYYEDSY